MPILDEWRYRRCRLFLSLRSVLNHCGVLNRFIWLSPLNIYNDIKTFGLMEAFPWECRITAVSFSRSSLLKEPALTTTVSRTNPFLLTVALSAGGSARGDLFWDDGDSIGSFEKGSYCYVIFTAGQVAKVCTQISEMFWLVLQCLEFHRQIYKAYFYRLTVSVPGCEWAPPTKWRPGWSRTEKNASVWGALAAPIRGSQWGESEGFYV